VTIHGIGSFVRLITGSESQKAQVTGATIREGGKVSYEVVWWSGTTRNCVWVEACEVVADAPDARPVAIGFFEEMAK